MWWKNRRPADFEWSEALSIGNAILDSEHRNLIAKINDLMRLIESGEDHVLPEAFGRLEAWLITHFENEKLFARALGIDFAGHEAAHERLLAEFDTLHDGLLLQRLKNSSRQSNAYYRMLHDWLIGHIVGHDMHMKPALLNYPYHYIPSEPCTAD